eukprot:TRINITY_DN66775_c0_g1_i1.p2 TRINITY_DN66775_c0_g1~~TRINITY_DN66775_c0_g1_i1.p2  ORF type:complete len:105 (-),score=10.52 TRINITY_DN66775_c0_g1_i1:56-370(-)
MSIESPLGKNFCLSPEGGSDVFQTGILVRFLTQKAIQNSMLPPFRQDIPKVQNASDLPVGQIRKCKTQDGFATFPFRCKNQKLIYPFRLRRKKQPSKNRNKCKP